MAHSAACMCNACVSQDADDIRSALVVEEFFDALVAEPDEDVFGDWECEGGLTQELDDHLFHTEVRGG